MFRRRVIAFLAFVSLGLPDALLGVAWPSVQAGLGVPLENLGELLAATTAGYLLSSFGSGSFIARLGVGRLLVGSTGLVIASLLLFALSTTWPLMLVGGLLAGLGAGAIDAGINLFAAQSFSAKSVTLLHACYGVGATLGPLIMTAAVTSAAGYRWGYAAVAMALAPLGVVFIATRRAWDAADSSPGKAPAAGPPGSSRPVILQALFSGRVLVGVALFFLYAGLEVTAGQWSFSLLSAQRGIPSGQAGLCVGLYWWSLTVGRVLFGFAAASAPAIALLRIGMVVSAAGAGVLWLSRDVASGAAGLAMLGFGLAPIYPLFMSLTPGRTGPLLAPHAVGFQVAGAYLGIAVIPGGVGLLAASRSLEVVGPALLVGAVALLCVSELAARSFAPMSDEPAPTGA